MKTTLLPFLTERDEAESAEGGIDPLGLYLIADVLGVKLVPGIRERQMHPRFLTALAVSLDLCCVFDEDTVAADGVSEPWLVFEWHLVEGLVRSSAAGQTIGLPGSQKAARAIQDGVPLSGKRYLKNAAIFGFHAIYRLLARTLGIESGGRLGDAGYQLLETWSKEQGLDGFVGSMPGPGQALRRQWLDAILDGLKNGATARSPGWAGWTSFSRHLGIYNAGPREQQLLWNLLLKDETGHRGDTARFLVSAEGQRIWGETGSERRFHEALGCGASDQLRRLLGAIASYETFSRLCQDAFDDSLCEMTRQRGKTSLHQLAQLPAVQEASRRVPEIFAEVAERLEPFGEAARFRELFGRLAECDTPAAWFDRLAEHHRTTQKRKPPDGKNPWFDRFDNGDLIVRPLYHRDDGGRHNDSFVHAYRTRSLWSFAQDLKVV